MVPEAESNRLSWESRGQSSCSLNIIDFLSPPHLGLINLRLSAASISCLNLSLPIIQFLFVEKRISSRS